MVGKGIVVNRDVRKQGLSVCICNTGHWTVAETVRSDIRSLNNVRITILVVGYDRKDFEIARVRCSIEVYVVIASGVIRIFENLFVMPELPARQRSGSIFIFPPSNILYWNIYACKSWERKRSGLGSLQTKLLYFIRKMNKDLETG